MRKLSLFFAIIFANLIMVSIVPVSFASITSTTPSVYKVDPPTSVLPGSKESNDQIIAFDELQRVTLTDDVTLDITSPGYYSSLGDLTPGTVSVGTTVDVHLLHFDPVGSPAQVVQLQGDIIFGSDILGIIVLDSSLYASDWLGNSSTIYPTVGGGFVSQRGLELEPQDYLTLSVDMRTLSVDFITQDKLDEVRIITNSVPIPSAIWLLGSGLIGLVGFRRKLRKGDAS